MIIILVDWHETVVKSKLEQSGNVTNTGVSPKCASYSVCNGLANLNTGRRLHLKSSCGFEKIPRTVIGHSYKAIESLKGAFMIHYVSLVKSSTYRRSASLTKDVRIL